MWALVAVLVVLVPVGLVAAVLLTDAAGRDADGGAAVDAPEVPDEAETPQERELDVDAPDPDALAGRDAELARLLLDVDQSERAMLAFQERVDEVLAESGSDPADLLTRVRDAATNGGEALDEVRSELVQPLDDRRIDEVRVAYLAHHDAWANYFDALAEDPTVLGGEGEGSRWLVSINLSAEVFARELREAVETDIDRSVRAYARDILARGFEQPDAVADV